MAEGGRMERSSESDDDDWVPRRCYQFSRRKRGCRRKNKLIPEGRSHEYIYSTKERHTEGDTCRKKKTDKFATKSCDNIFFHTFRCKGGNADGNVGRSRKSVRSETHYIWNASTRSEEHLPRLAVHPRASQIPKSNREQRFTWSLPSLILGGKNGALVGLFGKLGNKRRHRPPSPSPKGSLGRAFAPTPWILVEFSETSDFQEAESGNESDHSFEAAVAVLEERKLESQPSRLNHSGVSNVTAELCGKKPVCGDSLDFPVPTAVDKKLFTLQSMKSDSVPRHCLAPEEERSKSCGLRLAVAPRPLTLGIRGRLAIPSGQKDSEGLTGKVPEGAEVEGAAVEMLPARNVPRMPSLESIGSCSLDADVTASECSEGIGITASQRTLHSISFVDFSPLRATEESGVLVVPSRCDSTERTTDNQPSPRASSPSTATSPRPPSYVSLSCSISGYSPLAAYDSELRKGFRSGRDVIQVSDAGSLVAKQTLSLGDQENHTAKDTSRVTSLESSRASICSPVHRKPCVGEVAMNGSLQEHGGANGRGTEEVCSLRSGQQESMVGTVRVVQFTSQNKSYVRTVTRTFDSASFHGGSITDERPPSPTYLSPSKSFVQQRVERLYGPAALAQGFFRRNSPRSLGKGNDVNDERNLDQTSPRPFESLPVLRHLRPEFRNQLTVRGTSPKAPPVVTIIPISVEEAEPPLIKEIAINANVEVEKEILNSSGVNEVMVSALPDLCPAAPEVVLPLVPKEGSLEMENGTTTMSGLPLSDGEVKDGHFFIRLLKAESARLAKLVESAEKELSGSEEGQVALPEEAAGWLRSAAGQARLLIRQKMQQFEGLCHKHLLQSPGEAFPTTLEDLAGFWDMVLLQVASVDSMFQEIERLRASGWVETSGKIVVSKDGKPDSNSLNTPAVAEGEVNKKRAVTRKVVGPSPATNAGKPSGAAKARDEARRKMMEERRRAMRERQKGGAGEGSSLGEVEIFVPDTK